MVAFIEEHREDCGVEPICDVLPIARSTFYEHHARAKNPSLRPARAKRDDELRPEVRRVWTENQCVYGAQNVWKQRLREDVEVARCTVERLMLELGLRGVTRGRAFKVTTVADEAALRPPTWSTETSGRRGRTSSGSRTSPTSRRGWASPTSRSSPTSSRDASWVGAWRRP